MKGSHEAIERLTEVVTEIAEIVRDLDPGRVATYERIAKKLEEARGSLMRAKVYERS